MAFINHLEVGLFTFMALLCTSTSLYIIMPIVDLFRSGEICDNRQTDRRTEQIALPFAHAFGVQNGELYWSCYA